ncbi:MAG: hypothetical protein KME30_00415 [Iphinoe sp. HA4291-MV1]|jgi:hypothetical protein|nr:hypothetical protein [Iphinoe sp. HA4291-MV1]
MGYLMSLNNLKKVLAVGTVLTVAACFIAESAQAQAGEEVNLDQLENLFRYSGSPNAGATDFEFILKTSVTDSDTDPNLGKFPGAIRDAKYTCITKNFLPGCDTAGKVFLFEPGELTASLITSDNVTNYLAGEGFIDGVKYEARLNSVNSPDFIELGILVKPSGNLDLINSLSNLKSVIIDDTSSFYVGVRDLNSQNGFFTGVVSRFTAIKVPEPNATTPLLGVGTLGALLLLKRNRRSIRIFENKLTRSE